MKTCFFSFVSRKLKREESCQALVANSNPNPGDWDNKKKSVHPSSLIFCWKFFRIFLGGGAAEVGDKFFVSTFKASYYL